jgi:cytochrome d ubiquinol oxidase subunit II
MLAPAAAISLLLSLIVYALTGGADFGGGLWDLLASGRRAQAQRKAIAAAIAPIWEANHVWPILVVVVLFTAFPGGFSAVMTALNIPISVMLVGIVLRGSAFIFRSHDPRPEPGRRHWSRLFGGASAFTPVIQGVILGAMATGRIRVADGRVTTGVFAGWLTPFALSCGVFALGLFAFLAAVYLTLDTRGEPDLQADFRRRALWSGSALWPMAGIVYLTARSGAPVLFHGLTRWWAPLLLAATCLCGAGALGGLWLRRFSLARMAAAGQVALILAGWSLAQYPCLLTPDVTVANSSAPEVTLRLLALALAAGGLVLLPSLVFLFRLFKGDGRRRP